MPVPTPLHQLYAACRASTGVCTDSRTLQPGQLFVALKGPSFDGNSFAETALARGASAAVVDDPRLVGPPTVLWVPDALAALQALARHHRSQLDLPVVAITGSNGKTTTKELLRALLRVRYPVFVTPGNLNNHIGVPLCLLQLTPAHALAVLELGDNHPGEIALLCDLAQPTHGLITNLGEDHLEGYGTMAVNAATKLELFDYLLATGGTCLLNAADPWLAPYPAPTALRYNTPESGYTIKVTALGLSGTEVQINSPVSGAETYASPLLGGGVQENLLAAIVVAERFGLGPADIRAGLAQYIPPANRGELKAAGPFTVWLDAYNANPSSMASTLADFFAVAGPPKAVVLSDMLELGAASPDAHERLGALLAQYPKVPTVLIGPEMAQAHRTLGWGQWYPTRTAAEPNLLADLAGAKLVLLKGSRGGALEKLLPLLAASERA